MRVAVLRFVLSVEDETNIVPQGELGGELLLAENEGLKRMQQVFNRKSREEPSERGRSV